MKLSKLLKNVEVEKIIGENVNDIEIDNLQIDSNAVCKGSLFICLTGESYDSHGFIRQAEKYGAVAIITQKEIEWFSPQIVVKDTRIAMSIIASNFYQNVCDKMKIIGVVGTNGKTTTAHMIGSMLNNSGIKCGIIGTLGVFYGETFLETSLTTPDPIVLHKILFDMYNAGYKTVVMEVSAHAIYYKKVYKMNFEVGVFTNFTRDHLDFFKDMESYRQVKYQFFNQNYCRCAVVNADDQLGKEIIDNCQKTISYGIENPADVFAIDILSKNGKSKFTINLFDCVYNLTLPLAGRFNVYNALCASTAVALLGVKPQKIVSLLENISGTSGRIQCVYNGNFQVYIDYAHTPDGLKNLLCALKENCKNRLICVFGCGGNRDSGKREQMGEISAKYADFTIITSDNPRYEEPMEIIYQIEKGVLKHNKNYIIVQDRKQSIKYALDMAKLGDIIVVAGKGSENYQEFLGIKHPYNDKDTIDQLLRSILR